jgi:GTPase
MSRQAESSILNKKTLLLGIHAPYNRTPNINAYYEEFLHLIKTLDVDYDDVMYMKLREIDRAFFLSKGKLDELTKYCEENEIERIIISEPLTGMQERNLAEVTETEFVDRTKIILDIFEKSSHTAESKIQVEIAQLQYEKGRLVSRYISFDQQRGIIGMRGGSGETQKENETRAIEKRIQTLRGKLVTLEKSRVTQRQRRLESQLPLFCLVGYTNAGKSSLLNALTKSKVLAEDKLFATLDTTTRTLFAGSQKVGLVSDTVGFLQLLPPNLIAAFKSTLKELEFADLLLHVIDISDPVWQDHAAVVNKILHELDIDRPTLYVFNKVDKVELTDDLQHTLSTFQPHVTTSTITPGGIDALREYLASWKKVSEKIS